MMASVNVTCTICGKIWPAADPGVSYRSLDRLWWCTDETPCTALAARTQAEDLAGMDAALSELREDGWLI